MRRFTLKRWHLELTGAAGLFVAMRYVSDLVGTLVRRGALIKVFFYPYAPRSRCWRAGETTYASSYRELLDRIGP